MRVSGLETFDLLGLVSYVAAIPGRLEWRYALPW
jgi:hypothetical protein